jgi:CheY-like chemotaxis protein
MTNFTPNTDSELEWDADDAPLLQTASGKKVQVLIADADDTSRKLLAAMCELFDCACFMTSDGIEAVEAFSRAAFDIVLLEIELPPVDGLQAAGAIRAGPRNGAAIPIIAVTARTDPDDVRRYIAAGITGVVAKPIEASRLLEAMASALAAGQDRGFN